MFVRKLGQGGYAGVYSGIWNGAQAAFKVIPTERDGSEFTTNSNGPYEYHMQVKLRVFNFFYFIDCLKSIPKTYRL